LEKGNNVKYYLLIDGDAEEITHCLRLEDDGFLVKHVSILAISGDLVKALLDSLTNETKRTKLKNIKDKKIDYLTEFLSVLNYSVSVNVTGKDKTKYNKRVDDFKGKKPKDKTSCDVIIVENGIAGQVLELTKFNNPAFKNDTVFIDSEEMSIFADCAANYESISDDVDALVASNLFLEAFCLLSGLTYLDEKVTEDDVNGFNNWLAS
jgi:hypothetical protein